MKRKKPGKRNRKPAVAVAPRNLDLYAAIALAAVAIILYLPTLGANFVYDARLTVLGNDYAHDLRHLWDVATLRVIHLDVMDNNRPVYLATVMLNWALWGANPAGHQLCNIVLHGLVAALLFRLCRALLGKEASPWIPFAAVLVFAVHPLDCEAVAEMSFRYDLIVTACLLAAMNLAVAFQPSLSRRNVLLGAAIAACMFLAAGAKENGIAGPPLLICYWLLFRRNEPRTGWIVLCAAASVLVGAFLIARFTLRPPVSVIFVQDPHRPGVTLAGLIPIQPRIWTFYFRQIIWPSDLSADYGPYSVRNYGVMASMLTVIGVVCVQLVVAFQNRVFAMGAALFWFALLPVSNIVPIYRPIADRFLYLPMAGVAIMLASLPWPRGVARKIAFALALLAACALSCVTLKREKVWHDSLALWTDSAMKNPASLDSRNALGAALFEVDKPRESISVYESALGMDGGDKTADIFGGLAIALDEMGRTQEADAAFKKAVALDPRFAHPDLLFQALIWEKPNVAKLQVIADRNQSGK